MYYNDVGGSGTVGINGTNPRSGNGSVSFSTINSKSKADLEYLAGATRSIVGNYSATASLELFSELTTFFYECYRSSSSTASAGLHPSLRVLIDRDGDLNTTSDRGGLVFEGVNNGAGVASTDQWVSNTVTISTNL